MQQNLRHGFAVWVTKRISWRELIKHAPMHGSHADTAVALPDLKYSLVLNAEWSQLQRAVPRTGERDNPRAQAK